MTVMKKSWEETFNLWLLKKKICYFAVIPFNLVRQPISLFISLSLLLSTDNMKEVHKKVIM